MLADTSTLPPERWCSSSASSAEMEVLNELCRDPATRFMFGFDLAAGSTHEITEHPPSDRRGTLEKPGQHPRPVAVGRLHTVIVASVKDIP
jgi:hypothetical protein